MKTRRPIGVIRLLAPILGRAGKRWRGGPLVPMIWRRRPQARGAPRHERAKVALAAPASIFNLTFVWPAGTAARAEPMRRFEMRTHELIRAGRDTVRLVDPAERLWRESPDAAAPSQTSAPQWASGTPAAPSPRWEGRASTRIMARLSPRALATGHASVMRDGATGPSTTPVTERSETSPVQSPAAMAWRGPASNRAVPANFRSRPKRQRTAFVWRSEVGSGEAPAASPAFAPRRPSATELVWRRPAPAAGQSEPGAAHGASPSQWPGDSQIRVDRPSVCAAPPPPVAAPPPAAIQPAEMGRLVDEVVRRLERIGRDERMRRGI